MFEARPRRSNRVQGRRPLDCAARARMSDIRDPLMFLIQALTEYCRVGPKLTVARAFASANHFAAIRSVFERIEVLFRIVVAADVEMQVGAARLCNPPVDSSRHVRLR